MTDKELKNYIEKRCAEEPFEVPAFDGFFTEEELTGSVKPHGIIPLWTRIAVATAIAAAVALFVMLRPTNPADMVAPETAAMDEWIVSEAPVDEIHVDDAMAAEEPEFITRTVTEIKPSENNIPTTESIPAEVAADPSDDKNAPASANTSESSVDEAVSADNQKAEAVLTHGRHDNVWEDNVRTAQQRKKQRKQIATVALAFNCNNSLMTYDASSASTASMITRNYQSGSMLRSASVNRNEWKVPENLNMTKSEIAAYTPIYNLPLTGSLSISFPLGQHWDLRTGLTYTYLSANTYGKMDNGQSFSLYQHLHYLGIPLQFAFNILDNAFGLYVSAGGGLEKGLAGVQYSHVYDTNGEQISSIKLTQSVAGVQPYVSFQVGVSYRITDFLKVYIEPNLSYYFDTNQPISVRTKRPLYFGLGAGLRFATGK